MDAAPPVRSKLVKSQVPLQPVFFVEQSVKNIKFRSDGSCVPDDFGFLSFVLLFSGSQGPFLIHESAVNSLWPCSLHAYR